MANRHASLETIEDFLAQKRMAMAGIWRDPASCSAVLFKELCRRGHEVVPVNPNAEGVQGRGDASLECRTSVQPWMECG
jgi:predicted CoA-binding protein